ncbi:hypothetical protein MRB53_040302 [Persea americana]|nr:hypothetical protein MRB53_040302 [Persea americana]
MAMIWMVVKREEKAGETHPAPHHDEGARPGGRGEPETPRNGELQVPRRALRGVRALQCMTDETARRAHPRAPPTRRSSHIMTVRFHADDI